MLRVLIADDDPVSLQFLRAAIAQLGCDTLAVANDAAALKAVDSGVFDLLVLDRRMPDIGGTELLAALRARGSTATPAIGTSAEIDAAIDAELRAGGFADTIEKPTTLARLRRVISPHLHVDATSAPPAASTVLPLLDDAAAPETIGGDSVALRGLRSLLAHELETVLIDLRSATLHAETLRELLHRLRASCGFCGAMALAAAATRMEHALLAHPANVRDALPDFVHLCTQTAQALGR